MLRRQPEALVDLHHGGDMFSFVGASEWHHFIYFFARVFLLLDVLF